MNESNTTATAAPRFVRAPAQRVTAADCDDKPERAGRRWRLHRRTSSFARDIICAFRMRSICCRAVVLLGAMVFNAPGAQLFVESAQSGAGGCVVIVVSLATGGRQIAGVQFDFQYDPSAFTLSPVVDEQARAAGKGLYLSRPSNGQQRAMIIGWNQTPFTDGKLISVLANIRDDAPNGLYELQLNNPVAVDAAGDPVPIFGASGAITVQGPAGTAPPVVAAGVLNSASLLSGAVSPGELLTIIGAGIGPPSPVALPFAGPGVIATGVSGVSVTFDGIAAPILYADRNQLNIVAPFAISGNVTTQMAIVNGQKALPPVTLEVAPANPGIFTVNSSGAGPASVLNENGSINSPSNPAARGSVIAIYATGAGLLNPPSADGHITSNLASTAAPVSVTIAGASAEVLYAGAAPEMVAGVAQINARVPVEIPPSSSTPVKVKIGEVESPDGVTIAVQ